MEGINYYQSAVRRLKISPSLNEIRLLSEGFIMPLVELMALDQINSDSSKILHYLTILIRTDLESPLGISHYSNFENFLHELLVKILPKFKESALLHVKCALVSEISVCKSLESLLQWVNLILSLQTCNIFNSEPVKTQICIKLACFFSEQLLYIRAQPNLDSWLDISGKLRQVMAIGFHAGTFAESLADSLCEYLNRTLLKNLDQHEGKVFSYVLAIAKNLKAIGLTDDELNKNVAYVEEAVKLVYQEPEIQVKVFDYTQLAFDSILATNSLNPQFNIVVYKFRCPNFGFVAVKEYYAKNNAEDLNQVNLEIQILKTLSDQASDSNCFIHLYNTIRSGNRLFIYMEYHSMTLIEKITHMKKTNQCFSDEYLQKELYKLVTSYAQMEALRIFHRDIKPHNILYTDSGALKIIDFNISDIHKDALTATTQVSLIQGTRGYMAPELEEAYQSPNKSGKYKVGKADIFSLGITILQMYLLEDLFTLNTKENHERLMAKVNSVELEWLKSMLFDMLKLDYHHRPHFRTLVKYFPEIYTNNYID